MVTSTARARARTHGRRRRHEDTPPASPSRPTSVEAVQDLQRLAGNAATAQLLTSSPLTVQGDWSDTLSHAVGNIGSAVGNVVSNTVSSVEKAVGIGDNGKSKPPPDLPWSLTPTGALAWQLGLVLAASYGGGTLRAESHQIGVEFNEIPLFPARPQPVKELFHRQHRMVLARAGASAGAIALTTDLAAQLDLALRSAPVIGPGSLRHVRVMINPVTGAVNAVGQLHIAGTETLTAPAEGGLDGQATVSFKPPGGRRRSLRGDVFGGLRFTLQGAGGGTFDENVSLKYEKGALRLDLLSDVKLAGRLDAALDAVATISVEDVEVCEWTWPLYRWPLGESAAEYTLPIDIDYTEKSGTQLNVGEATAKPLDLKDVDVVLPTIPIKHGCRDLDDVLRDLKPKLAHRHR